MVLGIGLSLTTAYHTAATKPTTLMVGCYTGLSTFQHSRSSRGNRVAVVDQLSSILFKLFTIIIRTQKYMRCPQCGNDGLEMIEGMLAEARFGLRAYHDRTIKCWRIFDQITTDMAHTGALKAVYEHLARIVVEPSFLDVVDLDLASMSEVWRMQQHSQLTWNNFSCMEELSKESEMSIRAIQKHQTHRRQLSEMLCKFKVFRLKTWKYMRVEHCEDHCLAQTVSILTEVSSILRREEVLVRVPSALALENAIAHLTQAVVAIPHCVDDVEVDQAEIEARWESEEKSQLFQNKFGCLQISGEEADELVDALEEYRSMDMSIQSSSQAPLLMDMSIWHASGDEGETEN